MKSLDIGNMNLKTTSTFLLISALATLGTGAKPAEVALTCEKVSSTSGSDNTYIGQTILVKMSMKFPDQDTASAKAELLPSTTNTVFAVAELVNKSVGSDISQPSNDDWWTTAQQHDGPEYDANSKLYYKTRVAYDIGTVSNTGPGNNEEDSFIVIYFKVVLVSLGGNAVDSEYWVSCGLAYNNDAHIWISQFSTTLKEVDPGFSGTSDFTLNSIDEIPRDGKLSHTDLTMTITHAKADVKIEALVLTETQDLRPVKIEMTNAGTAFSFSLRQEKFVAETLDCSVRDTDQQSLVLDLGTIVNKGSQDGVTGSANEISFRIYWLVFNNSALGNEYTLAVGADIDGVEISVATFNATIVERTDTPSLSPSHTASAEGTNIVEAGGVGIVSLDLTIPDGTFFDYTLTLSTNKKGGATSLMSILSYSFATRSGNIPCDFESDIQLLKTNTDSTNPSVKNEANITFPLLNHGMSIGNTYNLKITFMFMPTATKNDIYELHSDFNGDTGRVDFTVGDLKAYDENVAYVFQSSLSNGMRVFSGSEFAVFMTVTTTRDSFPGPMSIETPIFLNDTNIFTKLKKASTKSKGANVICSPSGLLDQTNANWNDTLGDGARSTVNVPMVCNIMSVNDSNADVWEIVFEMKVLDTPDLMTSETNVTFGLGALFSGNQIFVGGIDLVIINPDDLSEIKFVTGVTIGDGPPDAWPGNYELQWSESLDPPEFHSHKLEWEAKTSVTQTQFKLKKPIYARYVRLTTNNYDASAVNYTVNSQSASSLTLLGNHSDVERLKPRLMLALDGDVETCMNLPLKNDTDIPPYFIAQIPTNILKNEALINNAAVTTSFTVSVVGEGLQCNATSGPQRVLVWHPAEALTSAFRGKLSKCAFTNGNYTYSGDKTLCQYSCQCSSSDTCSNVLMVIAHVAEPNDKYTLCDLSID